jgi:hypothetical protein
MAKLMFEQEVYANHPPAPLFFDGAGQDCACPIASNRAGRALAGILERKGLRSRGELQNQYPPNQNIFEVKQP